MNRRGSSSLRPAELLGSARFREFLTEISGEYDLVILDTSPLLPVGDTLEILPLVDGTLVCARVEQVTRDEITSVKSALERVPESTTGLVVTGLRPGRGVGYYGYYSSYRPISAAAGNRG